MYFFKERDGLQLREQQPDRDIFCPSCAQKHLVVIDEERAVQTLHKICVREMWVAFIHRIVYARSGGRRGMTTTTTTPTTEQAQQPEEEKQYKHIQFGGRTYEYLIISLKSIYPGVNFHDI